MHTWPLCMQRLPNAVTIISTCMGFVFVESGALTIRDVSFLLCSILTNLITTGKSKCS